MYTVVFREGDDYYFLANQITFRGEFSKILES